SMTMYKNGAVATMGTAAATVGNPLLALKWLAETSAGTQTPLRAGDVILTGSLGAIIPAAAGDVFESHVLGLGSVRAVVSS
ncbi:MAG: fumarylacetoacetate hydrolase family protein, partial [Alphaproteobacteria bacterium]